MDMIRLFDNGVTIQSGKPVAAIAAQAGAKEKTIAAKILAAHDHPAQDGQLHITFDGLISHDITYVGIIQTARASGLTRFPVPYVLTNCHNSLCAVGGTINEDDHVFGLSAAIKYGGDYVPANQAVIHQYAREMMTGCGKMLLGSDSHTRYGAIGTMGIGEGGPELVKQLLQNTYDVAKPQVVLVWLTGEVPHGVGPHDVAIALCGAVYKNGLVKNKILEFAGPGVKALPMDFRIGIDVMTTETACLSSIWETDEKVEEYLAIHGRPDSYRALRVEEGAYYDGCIEIDLSSLEPMAALPFHPSEAVPLRELIANPGDYLREVELRAHEQFGGKAELHLTEKIEGDKLRIDQGVIAGCSGGMYVIGWISSGTALSPKSSKEDPADCFRRCPVKQGGIRWSCPGAAPASLRKAWPHCPCRVRIGIQKRGENRMISPLFLCVFRLKQRLFGYFLVLSEQA